MPQLNNLTLDAKISWLISYMDKVPLEELIGIKISNIGAIHYPENDTLKTESITLCVGNTLKKR